VRFILNAHVDASKLACTYIYKRFYPSTHLFVFSRCHDSFEQNFILIHSQGPVCLDQRKLPLLAVCRHCPHAACVSVSYVRMYACLFVCAHTKSQLALMYLIIKAHSMHVTYVHTHTHTHTHTLSTLAQRQRHASCTGTILERKTMRNSKRDTPRMLLGTHCLQRPRRPQRRARPLHARCNGEHKETSHPT